MWLLTQWLLILPEMHFLLSLLGFLLWALAVCFGIAVIRSSGSNVTPKPSGTYWITSVCAPYTRAINSNAAVYCADPKPTNGEAKRANC